MANGALALINGLSTQAAGGVLGQLDRPCHFIGIDVENSGVGIERRATPLSSAVEPGENDGVFSGAQRNELPIAAIAAELLENPFVRLRSPVGEPVVGQALPGIGSRFG